MKPTSRLYSCLRCHTQVVICSPCDRGQIYCGKACSYAARTASCRAAEKRYQTTFRGKMNHARRQQRYRAKLSTKVTDRGSSSLPANALLHWVKNKVKKSVTNQRFFEKRCCFCNKPVSAWLRHGFLRHHPSLSARDWPSLKPP